MCSLGHRINVCWARVSFLLPSLHRPPFSFRAFSHWSYCAGIWGESWNTQDKRNWSYNSILWTCFLTHSSSIFWMGHVPFLSREFKYVCVAFLSLQSVLCTSAFNTLERCWLWWPSLYVRRTWGWERSCDWPGVRQCRSHDFLPHLQVCCSFPPSRPGEAIGLWACSVFDLNSWQSPLCWVPEPFVTFPLDSCSTLWTSLPQSTLYPSNAFCTAHLIMLLLLANSQCLLRPQAFPWPFHTCLCSTHTGGLLRLDVFPPWCLSASHPPSGALQPCSPLHSSALSSSTAGSERPP